MRLRSLNRLPLLSVYGLAGLVASLGALPAAAQPKPTFTYQSLGTLGGATSTAEGVNSNGEVVGMSDTTGGGRVPFVWDSIDGMQDLNVVTDGPLQENGSLVFGPDCTGDGSPDMYVLNAAYPNIFKASVVVFDGQTMEFVKVLITDHGEGLDRVALRFSIEDGLLYLGADDTPSGLNEHIYCYNVMTGEFLGYFATPLGGGVHYGTTVFGGPDVDEDGIPDVLVASSQTKQVLAFSGDLQFDSSGNVVPAEFLGFFVDTDAGLSSANDMLLGPDRNGDGIQDVYVGNSAAKTVHVFSGADGDAGGTFIEVFVDGGAAGLRQVNDLEWGPDGNLYVSDNGGLGTDGAPGMDVYCFDGTTGALLGGGPFVPSEVSGTTGGVPLFGFDLNGDLLISDQARYQILRFEGPGGQNPGAPAGVAVGGTAFTLMTARDINNAGQIVGWGYPLGRHNDTGTIAAYRYTPPGPGEEFGTVIDLKAQGLVWDPRDATAVNDDGDVAGYYHDVRDTAFLWREETGSVVLPRLGSQHMYVTALSNRDASGHVMVAGWALNYTTGVKRAWRYNTATGVVQDLGVISGNNSKSSYAWDINDAGVVTGTAANGAKNRAFTRALTGSMVDLGTLGGNHSYGTAIDPFGNVVGTADTTTKASTNKHQAFLRTTAHGMFKLEPQITNLPAAMQLKIRPNRINQYGQIVGPGPNDPAGQAFMLTPQ